VDRRHSIFLQVVVALPASSHGEIGQERVLAAGKKTRKAGFCAGLERPKHGIRRLTRKAGVGPAGKWKNGLKSFLLLNFKIQWGREGFWLDGNEASSKVLRYPA
jgi:hypothetical protein